MFGYVKETSPLDVSFTHTKHLFDREKLKLTIVSGLILLCLPLYNSNYRKFEIKPLVPRSLNLRDLTVI